MTMTDNAMAPPPAPLTLDNQPRSMLNLGDYDRCWDFANMVAKTKMVPKHFQGDPQAIMVAIQWGSEVGLPPMQALQGIALINGKPSIWGDTGMALVQRRASSDLQKLEISWDSATETATCTIARKMANGGSICMVETFSMGDARKAKQYNNKSGKWEALADKNTYQSYPGEMCKWRAFWRAARRTYSDLLRGLGGAEEVRDMTQDDAPPVLKEVAVTVAPPPARATDALKAELTGKPTPPLVVDPVADAAFNQQIAELTEPDVPRETSEPIARDPDLDIAIENALENVAHDQFGGDIFKAQAWLDRECIWSFAGAPYALLTNEDAELVHKTLKAGKRVANIGVLTKEALANVLRRVAKECNLHVNDLVDLAHEADVDYTGGDVTALGKDDLVKLLDAVRGHRDMVRD